MLQDAAAPASTARSGNSVDASPPWLPWMLAFFIASGTSGLIYQAIWTQYLNLILGSSAYAQSLVLAIFMGGMALGAWISARLVGRWHNLLMAYGGIEAAIGVAGIAFHAVFLFVTGWLYDQAIPGLSSPDQIGVLRWGVAAALIVPQTILLGMTFPIMSAGLMRWMPDRAGAVLGGLYFYNSIGAAFGALFATFVLVPNWGLPGAMAIAGIINILIYIGIWRLGIPAKDSGRAAAASGSAAARTRPGPIYATMLLAAGLTGLSSFMYEVGWVRMLSLALGSSLHSFELMLSAFIGGLALGGLYIRKRLDHIAEPVRYVGIVQVLMGVAALATLPLYDHSFAWVGWLLETLAPSSSGYLFYILATAAISIAIMLPAAFFAGMTLPIMTFVLLRRGASESAVGHVYAANTLGAIIGVVLMTHVAMPALGLKHSLLVAASIDLVLGLILLGAFGESGRRRALSAAAAASVIAVMGAAATADFDPRQLHSGVFRTSRASIPEGQTVLFQADGKTASVALFGKPAEWLAIVTNGKPDASLAMAPGAPPTADEPTMILLAILGLAYHSTSAEVANIGFGSGLTTHTLASSSLPRRITTVEIEPAMIQAARGFGARVARAYDDPRSQIVIDDARAYFSGQGGRYDVIISEPSNPWVSGVAKLFSVEFYGFAKRHLAEEGLLIQWVHTYELSDATLMSMLRALDATFEDYALFSSNNNDLLIVATPRGRLPAPNERFLRDASLRELAEIAGIRGTADLQARMVADRRGVRPLLTLDGGPTNSDFHPVLAHGAPRDRFMRAHARMVMTMHDSPLGIYSLLGLYPATDPDTWLTPPVENLMISKRRVAETLRRSILELPPLSPAGGSDSDLIAAGLGLQVRQLGGDCAAAAGARAAVETLVRAYQLTAPYISADARRALWAERPWWSCHETVPPALAAVRDALAALAVDDVEQVAALTRVILESHRDAIDPSSLPHFSHASLYAAVRRADDDDARGAKAIAAQHLALTVLGEFNLRLTEAVARATADAADPGGIGSRTANGSPAHVIESMGPLNSD